MADYLLVEYGRGPAWDPSRRRREQSGWDQHAAFMDALTGEGLVVLGGPIGEEDGEKVLVVVRGDDEAAVRARLDADPWLGGILTIASLRPWTIWLRAPAAP
jgi:uncharacterized protein YciI